MTYAATIPETPAFDVKDPDEQIYAKFDFTRDLSTGETVSAVVGTIVVTVVKGTHAAPDDILSGAPSIVNGTAIVAQKITGGVDGVDYRLECRVDTTITGGGSRRLVLVGILPVREAK